MKLTDKAILRMVSESPGRNTSEPIGGPDKKIDPRCTQHGAGRESCIRKAVEGPKPKTPTPPSVRTIPSCAKTRPS